MKAPHRVIFVVLFLGALFTIGAIVVPWVTSAIRGDLWVNTLGYQVSIDPSVSPGKKRITFDFFGSVKGGTGRIGILSVESAGQILMENPVVRSTRTSTFHASDRRELDELTGTLPLDSVRDLPETLTVRGFVEYQPTNESEKRRAEFTLLVSTHPERRNSVFDRAKLHFGKQR